MLLPTVAIVGRPNVGKSSLFNRLVGRDIAIVDPTAGVTRDRLLHPVNRDGMRFDLIDTGGIGIVDEAKLELDIERQIQRAIEHADRILFVVDVRDGLTPLDQQIANRLRPHHDRVQIVVNKVDHDGLEPDIHQFLSLGLGDPVAVSANQVRGLLDVLEALARHIPTAEQLLEAASRVADDGRLKVCLAGRRNVGKSSLTNALCGEERVIVADHPGTTRDAIDISIERGGHGYVLIDTAGLRKKRQLSEDLEFYAACRTERAIKRTDVVLLVLDASDELGTVDKKIAHFCEVEGKPTILVINKWDIAEAGGAERDKYETWLRDRLPGLRHAPMVTTCALRGSGLDDLLDMARAMYEEAGQRIATAEANKLLEAALQRRRPRRVGPSETKLYYMSQVEIHPPTFVVSVNRTDWMEPGYHRYLENFIRARTPFARVPLRILFKARESRFHEHLDQAVRTTALPKGERSAGLIVPKHVRAAQRKVSGGGRGRGGGRGGRR
jgi:GTP-binding protein